MTHLGLLLPYRHLPVQRKQLKDYLCNPSDSITWVGIQKWGPHILSLAHAISMGLDAEWKNEDEKRKIRLHTMVQTLGRGRTYQLLKKRAFCNSYVIVIVIYKLKMWLQNCRQKMMLLWETADLHKCSILKEDLISPLH